MRVKFDNHIELCRRITHSEGSKLLLITTTYNSIYTVDCITNEKATELYNKAYFEGYIDISKFYYDTI